MDSRFVWLPDLIKETLDIFPHKHADPEVKYNHNLLHWGGRSLTRTRWCPAWKESRRLRTFQCSPLLFFLNVSHPVRDPFSQRVVYLNRPVSQSTAVLPAPVSLTRSGPAVTALHHRNVPLLSHGLPLYSFSQFTWPLNWQPGWTIKWDATQKNKVAAQSCQL